MNLDYKEFFKRLLIIQDEIANACAKARRLPSDVELLAVTKNHPVDAAEFVAQAGLRAVGENRVQEGAGKRALCKRLLSWELIGHLQSNKAKQAVESFDRIQSLDSIKLAELLDKAASSLGKSLPVLLQINAGRDPAKFGAELEDAAPLLDRVLCLKSLRVDGLMTIAPLSDDPEVARRTFATLRELRDTFAVRSGLPLSVLSIGMSGDLSIAIGEGSTQIRVGTALFGARS